MALAMKPRPMFTLTLDGDWYVHDPKVRPMCNYLIFEPEGKSIRIHAAQLDAHSMHVASLRLRLPQHEMRKFLNAHRKTKEKGYLMRVNQVCMHVQCPVHSLLLYQASSSMSCHLI